jgi:hypothetical protein
VNNIRYHLTDDLFPESLLREAFVRHLTTNFTTLSAHEYSRLRQRFLKEYKMFSENNATMLIMMNGPGRANQREQETSQYVREVSPLNCAPSLAERRFFGMSALEWNAIKVSVVTQCVLCPSALEVH